MPFTAGLLNQLLQSLVFALIGLNYSYINGIPMFDVETIQRKKIL